MQIVESFSVSEQLQLGYLIYLFSPPPVRLNVHESATATNRIRMSRIRGKRPRYLYESKRRECVYSRWDAWSQQRSVTNGELFISGCESSFSLLILLMRSLLNICVDLLYLYGGGGDIPLRRRGQCGFRGTFCAYWTQHEQEIY